MIVTQLELELWNRLRQAQQMPEAIDVVQLLDGVEATATQLTEAEQLGFTGGADDVMGRVMP